MKISIEKIKTFAKVFAVFWASFILSVIIFIEDNYEDIVAVHMMFSSIAISICYYYYQIDENKKTKKILYSMVITAIFLIPTIINIITKGQYHGFVNFLIIVGVFVLPIIYLKKNLVKQINVKEKKYSEEVKQNKEGTITENKAELILEIENYIKNINNGKVKEELNETLQKITLVLEEDITLEQKHLVNRLLEKDFYNLIKAYFELKENQKMKMEKLLLEKNEIIENYLDQIIERIDKMNIKEFEKQMEIIKEIYK